MTANHTLLNLGKSVGGRTLEAAVFMPTSPCVLFLGGVHGDEPEGVWLMESLLQQWRQSFSFQHCGAVVWAQVNPDGVHAGQRGNGNGIDLNRNLPTKDWTSEVKNPRYQPGPHPASEPENKALIALIEKHRPQAILSAHSFHTPQVNSNGPAKPWAEALSKICGYPVTEDIGYPTPGCLGTYAGFEKKIPTITLEIERGLAREKVLALHLPVIEKTMQYFEEKKRRP